MRRNRNAKILATLGPTSSSPEVIRALFEAGADVFRLNFSHGTHADHRARYDAIRAVEREAGRPIGVLADLQGPKLRVGIFTQGRVTLEPGRPFRLDLDMAPGDERRVPLPHPEIFQALCPGAELLLDDGKIRLAVERCGTDFAETVVATGGPLSDRKGMNVPGVMLPLSALTAKDRQDLAFALELRADWIAFSFVQRPEDLDEVRELGGGGAGIVAKLEKPAAVERLDEIVARTDALMVARGDLGVELPPEQVPAVQRMALRACRAAGKPAIRATQMLESMIEAPAPTRAEASDVATAVYEGADAVSCALRPATAILPVAATVIYTTSGASALRASGRRPRSWRSPRSRRARRLPLVWSVHVIHGPHVDGVREMIDDACATALAEGFGREGDIVAISAGIPFRVPGNTNLLHIARLGEHVAAAWGR